MADLITKVQGAVIDLENSGGGGLPPIVGPTPELIEKFDIGDVWLTSKEAEQYYDKDFIFCFDTPTTITKDDGEWFEIYKIPIQFEDTVNITPIEQIVTTSSTVARQFEKGFIFDGGMFYKHERYKLSYSKDGITTVLNGGNPSNTIVDILAFTDELGDRWFYGCSGSALYRTLNPSSASNDELIYNFGNTMDEYHIYQEGDYIYSMYIDNGVASCLLTSHSGAFDSYFVWENVDLENTSGFFLFNYVKYLDEIFFKDIDENGYVYWNKISIKSGFITREFITLELARAYFQSYGFTDFTEYDAHYLQDYTDGVSVDVDKTLMFTGLYRFVDNESGLTYYMNFSFSRGRGLGMVMTSYNESYDCRQPIDNRFLISESFIYKNYETNTSKLHIRESGTQVYDNIEVQDLFRTGTQSNHFYGMPEDNKKNYVIGYSYDDGKYYVCEIEILETDGYLPQATVPAMLADSPDLQYYGRRK